MTLHLLLPELRVWLQKSTSLNLLPDAYHKWSKFSINSNVNHVNIVDERAAGVAASYTQAS